MSFHFVLCYQFFMFSPLFFFYLECFPRQPSFCLILIFIVFSCIGFQSYICFYLSLSFHAFLCYQFFTSSLLIFNFQVFSVMLDFGLSLCVNCPFSITWYSSICFICSPASLAFRSYFCCSCLD